MSKIGQAVPLVVVALIAATAGYALKNGNSRLGQQANAALPSRGTDNQQAGALNDVPAEGGDVAGAHGRATQPPSDGRSSRAAATSSSPC